MNEMERIRAELREKAFKVVDELPVRGEVSLRLGINMNCPIVEVLEEDREEIRLMLKGMGYRMMIRQKDDGIYQFIVRS